MPDTVVTVGRLLTGDWTRPVDDATVLVGDDGTIRDVGPRRDVVAGARGADELAFPTATALPGLINGHVHLSFDEGRTSPEAMAELDLDDLLPRAHDHAAGMLRLGVTTVRDLGDRHGAAVALRDRHAAGGLRPIPRVLAAGPPLTPPGGHCWFLGGEVEPEPRALAARVHELADQGVDWIKVMASGGTITAGGADTWESQFGVAELRAIVEAAASRGLPVAAHAHGVRSIHDAAAAGVATVEHCSMLTSDDLVPQFDPELAAAIRDAGIYVNQADNHDHARLSMLLNEAAADGWVRRARWLADHGVSIFSGTDAGVGPFDQTTPALVRHGDEFAPADILDMATTTAARALRIDDHVGRLAPGYRADILVVERDPLADIAALADVVAVIADGWLVS